MVVGSFSWKTSHEGVNRNIPPCPTSRVNPSTSVEVRSMVTRVRNALGSLMYFRLSKRDSKGCSFETGETPFRSERIFLPPFRVDVKFNCHRGAKDFHFLFFWQECFF
jgi:hypothetical protein